MTQTISNRQRQRQEGWDVSLLLSKKDMQLCSLSTHLVNWQIHYWKITLENIANTWIKSDEMRKELQWGLFQSDSCLMHCREITQHWAPGHARFLTNFSCFKENQIKFDTSIKTTAIEKKKEMLTHTNADPSTTAFSPSKQWMCKTVWARLRLAVHSSRQGG